MKAISFLFILFTCIKCYAFERCPHEKHFSQGGWIIHHPADFFQIAKQKLHQFLPEIGSDLVFDHGEYYHSAYSHDPQEAMWIVIWDRLSTGRDEMWGDVAISSTGLLEVEHIFEIRWYDPVDKKKHIIFNSNYACCLTTRVPLAYNTIF